MAGSLPELRVVAVWKRGVESQGVPLGPGDDL